MQINSIGFIFDKNGDKQYFKTLINSDIEKFKKKIKKVKKILKNLNWTLNEYIQAIFPKIYSFALKINPNLIDILIENKIKISKKEYKTGKFNKYKNIKIKSDYVIIQNFKIRKNYKILLYLRDLNGIVYIDNSGSFILTVGELKDIYSKDKLYVQDPFNNKYILNSNEISPVRIDINGHQYYHDILTHTTNLILNPNSNPDLNLIKPQTNKINLNYGTVFEGDYVIMRLRTKDGRIIVDNSSYIPVLAQLTYIFSKDSLDVIDAIGNIHRHLPRSEFEYFGPIDFNANGHGYYINMTDHAVKIYSQTP